MLIFTSFLSYQYLLENGLSLKFVKIPMGSGQEAYQVIPCEGKWMEIWYKYNIIMGMICIRTIVMNEMVVMLDKKIMESIDGGNYFKACFVLFVLYILLCPTMKLFVKLFFLHLLYNFSSRFFLHII